MIEQESLQLLVDGELTDAEQREVLLRLDCEPEAWRTLAVAFVEAQRWRKELQALMADTGPQASRPLNTVRPAAVAKPDFRFFGRSMLAAACALAVLSFAAGHFLGIPRIASHPQAANVSSELDTAPHPAPSPGESHTAASFSARADAHLASAKEAAAAETILVEVPDSDPDVIRYRAVPLVDAARGAEVAQSVPSVISDGVQDMLERYGFEVVENRQFTPVRLLDGRRAIVVSAHAKVRHVRRAVF